MKKQKKQLLILLIALIVLVAGFFAITKYNESQIVEETKEEKEYIIDIDGESVTRMEYSYEGKEYAFVKEAGTWKYVEDSFLSLNQNKLNTMQNYITHFAMKQKLENVTDLAEYGLADPERYISFETADEKYTVLVGDRNSYTLDYYISLEGSNTVYIIEATTITVFNKTISDLK